MEVRVKRTCDLAVRIPEWATPDEVACEVNDQSRSLGWDGRYAQVGESRPSDVVTLRFPIHERTDVVHIQKQRYTLVRKGNDVVLIDPPGRYAPLYQRDHYRQKQVRWRKMSRYVPEEAIRW